ncbi:MAG: hypothetical protein GOU98_03995 [Candidatus Altiarchaeota archaeon]|nr:hypothetical protein [Candidatus Altiarchaeota archaeon]
MGVGFGFFLKPNGENELELDHKKTDAVSQEKLYELLTENTNILDTQENEQESLKYVKDLVDGVRKRYGEPNWFVVSENKEGYALHMGQTLKYVGNTQKPKRVFESFSKKDRSKRYVKCLASIGFSDLDKERFFVHISTYSKP